MKYYSSKKHVILALLTALFVGILFYNSKAPVYGDTMKSGVVKCSSIDTVNTRTEPSINSEIINKLANGKTVFILEEVAGNDNHTWYYVSYNLDANGESKTGYIRSDYVTVGDNSLQTLSINPGTLSPEFSYDTTRYTASVDYNVTSVEVSAIPTDENSQVVGISGNENLAVGENTIEVDIQASNGVIAAYYIDVTRQEEAAEVSGSATTSSGTGMSAGEMYELQVNYQKLTEDYEALQQTHKITIIVMGAVILILAILLILMFFRSGRMDEEFDEDDEYDEDEQSEDEALDELDEDEEREELAEPEEPEVTNLEPDDTTKQPPVHVEVIDIHRDTPADMKSAMEELAVEEADSVVGEIAAAEAKSVMEEMVAAKADSVIEEIAAAEAKSAMEEITAVKTTPVVEESLFEEPSEVELSLEEALLRNALADVTAEDKPEEKPEQEHPKAYEEELREEPEEEYEEELQEEPEEEYEEELQEDPEEEYEEEEPEEEYEEEAPKKKSFWGMLKSLSDVFEEEDLDDYDEVRHVEPEEDAEEDSDEEVDESAFADEFEDEFARGRAKKEKKAAKKSKKDSKKGSVTTEEEDDDLEFLDL